MGTVTELLLEEVELLPAPEAMADDEFNHFAYLLED